MKTQNKKSDWLEDSPKTEELIQQKIILKEINKYLEEKIKQLEIKGSEHESEIYKINELEQQKILLTELNKMASKNDADVDEI